MENVISVSYTHLDVYKRQVMACPSQVDKIKNVSELEGTEIDQVFIGSCTNGRLEDLRAAAEVLKGKKVADYVKLIVTPASRKIYRQAIAEGIMDTLAEEMCIRDRMEYDILMFLHNNPQLNTAAEIVKSRKSTKSHVSTSLKKLENRGFVKRIQSEDNKKHIEIVLLDRAAVSYTHLEVQIYQKRYFCTFLIKSGKQRSGL